MNGLTTSFSSWEEKQPLMMSLYSIIDAKIDFIELKTRKMLNAFSRKKTQTVRIYDNDTELYVPSMTDLSIEKTDSAQLFAHIESLSRSITILENMKFSLSEENATDMMELLNDDKYLTINSLEMSPSTRWADAA